MVVDLSFSTLLTICITIIIINIIKRRLKWLEQKLDLRTPLL